MCICPFTPPNYKYFYCAGKYFLGRRRSSASICARIRPIGARNRKTRPRARRQPHKSQKTGKPVSTDHPNPQARHTEKTASVFTQPGSFADMQQSPRECPLPGAKQTYLGQPRVGRRVYGKQPFSVYRRSEGDSARISSSGGSRSEGVYGKDMISVQATACTENQGLPYSFK